MPFAFAPAQFASNHSSTTVVPSLTRMNAKSTPSPATLAQSISPCHLETSMPSMVAFSAHTLAACRCCPTGASQPPLRRPSPMVRS
jgi:hypothetical protein